jgi:hypothetical protein
MSDEDQSLVVMGEIITPPKRRRTHDPGRNLKPGYHKERRPQFRIRVLQEARRVYGPDVGDLVGSMIEGVWRKQIAPAVAQLILARLLPEHLPADISRLPKTIETAFDWVVAMRELYQLRRDQQITDAEWKSLREGVTDHWRSVTEGQLRMAAAEKPKGDAD